MMDENSAGCASEGVDLDALQDAYVLLTEPAGMTEALRKRIDAAQRMVVLSLPAIIAELRAARTLPAPTISQDVPAPAAGVGEAADNRSIEQQWFERGYMACCADVVAADKPLPELSDAILERAWERQPEIGAMPHPVPAPAAVTAEMVRAAENAWPGECVTVAEWPEFITAHLNAALSAATPLQSDPKAENARLAYMAGYRDGFHDGNVSGEDSWWDQVAAADGWQQYCAALQGADNHE